MYWTCSYFSVSDEKTKRGLERIINVWEDRKVYDSTIISGLRSAMKIESPITPISTNKKSDSHLEKIKRKSSEKKTKSIGKLDTYFFLFSSLHFFNAV